MRAYAMRMRMRGGKKPGSPEERHHAYAPPSQFEPERLGAPKEEEEDRAKGDEELRDVLRINAKANCLGFRLGRDPVCVLRGVFSGSRALGSAFK